MGGFGGFKNRVEISMAYLSFCWVSHFFPHLSHWKLPVGGDDGMLGEEPWTDGMEVINDGVSSTVHKSGDTLVSNIVGSIRSVGSM